MHLAVAVGERQTAGGAGMQQDAIGIAILIVVEVARENDRPVFGKMRQTRSPSCPAE
jgi:hypothetical protein